MLGRELPLLVFELTEAEREQLAALAGRGSLDLAAQRIVRDALRLEKLKAARRNHRRRHRDASKQAAA